jgi:hypothetical protein
MLGSALDWFAAHSLDLAVGALLSAVCWPLVVLTHELGHAAVGLVHTEGLVRVRVGRSPGIWRARLGRLALELHPLPAQDDSAGLAITHARFGWESRVMYLLAGPAAGCGVGLLLILLGVHSELPPLTFAGGLTLFAQLSNLLPSETSGRRNDGARIVDTLRTRRAPSPANPLAAVETRFLVLVTDARGTLAGTGGQVVKVLNALERRPSDRSKEARALVRMAFSGWCWREAERGETAPLRESVLDARHRATLMGLSQGDIAGWTAMKLARTADLAAASPAPNSLEYGLRRARASSFTDGVPEQDAEFAFRFGVALHDVVAVTG